MRASWSVLGAAIACAPPSSCPDDDCAAQSEVTGVTTSLPGTSETSGVECPEVPLASAATMREIADDAIARMSTISPDAVLFGVGARPLEDDGTIAFPAWPGDDPDAGWTVELVSPSSGLWELRYFADGRCPNIQFIGGDLGEIAPLDTALVPDSPELVSQYLMDPACAPLSDGVSLVVLGPSPNIELQMWVPTADPVAPTWTMTIAPDGMQTIGACG